MEPSAATTQIGPLLLGASFQLAGLAGGAVLCEGAQFLTGRDPRRARYWAAEALVIGLLAAVLGFAFTRVADVSIAGPPFGAALTTFAVLSGFHAFTAARRLRMSRPWVQGAAHAVGCVVVGMLGFTAAVLAAGFGTR